MQMRAPRSKPLTRVFVRTRAGTRIRGALRAATARCASTITRWGAVLVDVVVEANHFGHCTCVAVRQLKSEIGWLWRASELRATAATGTPNS